MPLEQQMNGQVVTVITSSFVGQVVQKPAMRNLARQLKLRLDVSKVELRRWELFEPCSTRLSWLVGV